ncbi:hypothetical protein C8R46DRAFT_1342630 [Mycena filopes]|nr:hypothetical protein C8R46DRAFT_1342630 [Mycena filopes]
MHSLPDLPNELLFEVSKYYPKLYIGIDADIRGVRGEDSNSDWESDTVRALAQTNRRLRAVFFPIQWERAYACFTTRNPKPQPQLRARGKMLQRRLRGIRETENVWPHIRSLSITLEECDIGNSDPLQELFRVLGLLPSLRALTIFSIPREMAPVLEMACDSRMFPSIRALALPDHLAPILHRFPNVHTLTGIHDDSGPHQLLLEAAKGHSVHRVDTLNDMVISAELVLLLRQAIPNVRRLSLWRLFRLDDLRLLDGMDNLSELHVRIHPDALRSELPEPLSEDIITHGRRVLASSKALGKKKELRVQYCDHFFRNKIYEETVFAVEGHLLSE